MARASLSTAGLKPLERTDLSLLLNELEAIPDPRRAGSIEFPLADMLLIALCCLLSGQLPFTGMSRFAELKHDFLSEVLGRPAPQPSHDAFRYLFMVMDERVLCQHLDAWTRALLDLPSQPGTSRCAGFRHIAMDGKSKASGQGSRGGRPLLHRVSAFLRQRGLTLTDRSTPDKGGEVQALRETIQVLDLQKAVVTIDAGGTFAEIATALQEKGADYVLALKGNQPKLNAQIECYFETLDANPATNASPLPTHSQSERRHGRHESREVQVCDQIDWLEGADQWPGLRAVVRVRRQRQVGRAAPSTETSYYLSSWNATAEQHAEIIRGHWSIENQLHWVLDANWREDCHPLRQHRALRNLTTMTRFALNLLRSHPRQDSIKGKMHACCLSDTFLTQCLGFVHA